MPNHDQEYWTEAKITVHVLRNKLTALDGSLGVIRSAGPDDIQRKEKALVIAQQCVVDLWAEVDRIIATIPAE